MRLSRWAAAGFLALLGVSLAYNALWIASVPSIQRLGCLSHFAEVHADAIESREAAHWERAGYLYGYLLDYAPHAPRGCENREAGEFGWATPAVALAVQWKRSQVPGRERVASRDAEEFERRYAEAVQHLELDFQTAGGD